MLVLVIGDFYIPERAIDLPAKFKKLLVPGKIGSILVTGTPSMHIKNYLESISPMVISAASAKHIAKSQKSLVVEFEGWKLGVIEQASCLLDRNDLLAKDALARALSCDILITNGSHQFAAYERNGRFFLDPGSATGAYTLDLEESETVPSFVLMDLTATAVTLYIYKLVQGKSIAAEFGDHLAWNRHEHADLTETLQSTLPSRSRHRIIRMNSSFSYSLRSTSKARRESPTKKSGSVTFPTASNSCVAANGKKKGALSKKIKMDANKLSPEMAATPERPSAAALPQTAPSKIEAGLMGNPFDLASPLLRVAPARTVRADFIVWEDPALENDSDHDSLVPLSGSLMADVSDADSDHAELLVPEKENQPPLAGPANPASQAAPAAVAVSNVPFSASASRSVLGEMKVTAMAEYQELIGQAFKIACSPTLYPPAAASGAHFKVPFHGMPYSKELPPPSKITRTIGSGKFRATSINLFPSAKGASGLVMDTKSPSTPHRIPDLVHSTRVTKRLFSAPGAALNHSPDHPPSAQPNQCTSDSKQKSAVIPPSTKALLDGPLSAAVYNLRPRPRQNDCLVPSANVNMASAHSRPLFGVKKKRKGDGTAGKK
ncbi:Vacuolar protein sorting-associated protein 29 [Kappamyces sp. JEL0680]|nr:Vacuolar protein sorting-associated protein 29 [Kappamyces sp. JEL0680]